MSLAVQNRSWLEQNTVRSYPLVDWASATDTTNSFRIAEDLLAELYFPIGPDLSIDPTKFYIARVAVYATGLSISLGYDNGTSSPPLVATATVGRSAITPFLPLPLYGLGAFSSSIGKLVLGRMDGTDAQGAGQYRFTPAAAQLDVDCIRQQLQGVSSLAIQDNNGIGAPLFGNVNLSLGSNLQLTAIDASTIQISAIQGAGLNATCACSGLSDTPTPITSLMGLTSPSGAFQFVGDACIDVSTSGSTIKFADQCSSPCCGCQETQTLQSAIDYITGQLRTLRDFQTRLQTEVNKTNAVVIASRVSDTGCVTCS